MPKVTMQSTSAGPNGSIRPGAVVDVSDEYAKELIRGRFARYTTEDSEDLLNPEKRMTTDLSRRTRRIVRKG